MTAPSAHTADVRAAAGPPALRRWGAWALLAFLYLVSRIPLIYAGFGSDYDCLLYGQAGKNILEKGVYEISRFPGFPLYEYLCALLLLFGDWHLINWVTSIISFLAVVLFYLVMTDLGYDEKSKVLLCVFLALFPTFWVNSATVMDYAWAFFFVIASYRALLRERWELSSLCLAFACGFRLTSGIFFIPFAYRLVRRKGARGSLAVYILIMAGLILVLYAPVLLRYGKEYLTHSAYFEAKAIYLRFYFLLYFAHRIVKFLGFPGCLFLVYSLIRNRRQLKGYLWSNDIDKRTHSLAIASLLLLFLVYPGQLGYLLPIVPFALLALEKILPLRHLVILFVLVVSSNFVDVSLFDSKERRPELAVRQGALLSDLSMRRQRIEFPGRLAGIPFPDHSLIIIQGLPMAFGFDTQLFEIVEHSVGDYRLPLGKKRGSEEDIYFLNAVALSVFPRAEDLIDEFKNAGYQIYMQKESYLICKQVGEIFKIRLKDEWDIRVFDIKGDSFTVDVVPRPR